MIETMSEAASRTTESPDLAVLREINAIANELAFQFLGERSTCIWTSAALAEALVRLGHDAILIRVEAAIYTVDGFASYIGWMGKGWRKVRFQPGKWNGHVAVLADGAVLMDPTQDQAYGGEPFIAQVTDGFLAGDRPLFWADGMRRLSRPRRRPYVRYRAFPKLGGWKSKQAYRARGAREELADRIVRAAEAKGLGHTLDQAA